MNFSPVCVAAFAACVLSHAAATAATPMAAADSVLTLEDARVRTLARHPALASARALVEAARRRGGDAGRRPNPVLSGEVENFGNSANRLETTLQLGQTFELGGDRRARALVAQATLQLVEADLTAEQRGVIGMTAERFIDAWGFQEKLSALRAAEQLAAEAIQAAQARHTAGAAPITERVRAVAQHALRRVERERAEAELVLARGLLAAQWGDPEASFTRLVLEAAPGDTARAADPLAAVESHPQRLRAAAEVSLFEARLREARAARVPDLDLQFGVRHLSETGTSGFVAALALPLPLWNPQRGGVAAAEAEIVAARSRQESSRLTLRNEFQSAVGRVAIGRAMEQATRTRIQPAALEALRQVRSGYRAGRLSYTDLIDAQRAVREADLALTEASIDLWRARIALERLIGAPIPIQESREVSR